MSNDPWELPPPEENGSDSWALPADDHDGSRPSPTSPESGDSAKPDAESAASDAAASEPTPVEPSEQPAPAPQPQSESQPQASQDDAPEFAWSNRAPDPETLQFAPERAQTEWSQWGEFNSQSQPGQTEAQAYAQGGSQTPQSGNKKFNFNGKVLAIIAVVLLVVAGGTTAYLVARGGKSLAAMSYISSEDPGPDPFMESSVNEKAVAAPSNSNLVNTSSQGAIAGNDPNLYGGSGQLSVCDADALVANLNGNDDLNAAFAQGIGINASDVPRYVKSLTPVVLRQDTWVTNHGYDNGRATPYQSVLQRGTAVMVDAYGVPRVRCSCGNPLAEAWNGYTAPEASKANWDDYEPRSVVTIYETDITINNINVIDIEDGTSINIDIDDDDVSTQEEILDAVTEDTPTTSPKDMGVRPDGKLLGELGLAEAEGDASERPTGADRFNDYQQWAETGWGGVGDDSGDEADSSDWKSQTTEVDPEEFWTDSAVDYIGHYYIQFSNRDVGCFINPESQAVYCFVKAFLDSGREGRTISIDPKYPNSSGNNGPLNYLIAGGPRERFLAVSLMLESPLIGLNPSKLLEPGESVTVGGMSCFNLGDTIGCDAIASGFIMDRNDDVYVDHSEIAVLDQ